MLRFISKYVVIGLALSAIILLLLPAINNHSNPNGLAGIGDLEKISFANAVNSARPAIVRIVVEKTRIAGNRKGTFLDQGSGIIYNDNGYVLTSLHVVLGARQIRVELLDGRRQMAKFVGQDPVTDLALLKIDFDNLSPIAINLDQDARVGDLVFAIGYPVSAVQTTTMGIISATNRFVQFGREISDFIQTDAAINPGTSGGALVNVRGELVGLIAAYDSNRKIAGIGYAIPMDRINFVFNELVTKGRVSRGWLGLETASIISKNCKDDHTEAQLYQSIINVQPSSPADKAGVKRGDLLVEINGESINNFRDLYNLVTELRPNTSAALKVLRPELTSCKELTITVEIAEYPIYYR